MADIKKIISALHPLERKTLPLLSKSNSVEEIISLTGLKEVEVIRALQWLQDKKILEIKTESKEFVELDKNGLLYLKSGLPEKRFLDALKDKELPLAKIAEKSGIAKEEVNICLGILRSKSAVIIVKDKELKVKLTDNGKRLLTQNLPEENLLKKQFPVELNKLTNEEKQIVQNLKKRKDIIKIDLRKTKIQSLTELGQQLIKVGIKDESIIDKLTPQIIRSSEWKQKPFRAYNIKADVPKVYGGKFHHYRKFLDNVRKKFLSLGFTEMTGPIVESDFWDMDALFMPQFHSARDIHQAYYIKEPKSVELDKKVVDKVKQTHEDGGDTESKGWGYNFDLDKTRRALLRTQGTACSTRMLASKDLKIPGKYFGITRCFRYDVIDATHLPDFNQTEGIIVEENLTFRHLIGLLKMFAKEFAETDQIKIVPSYFPFTEPSAELFAKHPQLGWIELGGAGIFRPEVVVPLVGKNISVLAWGLGIDRLGMFKLGIKDIRDLFSHDISFLRNSKVI